MKHWGDRVILNVDLPISEPWQNLLQKRGYRIDQVTPAYTQRYGGLDNAKVRAEHEVVILATREPHAVDDTTIQPQRPNRRLRRRPGAGMDKGLAAALTEVERHLDRVHGIDTPLLPKVERTERIITVTANPPYKTPGCFITASNEHYQLEEGFPGDWRLSCHLCPRPEKGRRDPHNARYWHRLQTTLPSIPARQAMAEGRALQLRAR
jgi:hypothetical protein